MIPEPAPFDQSRPFDQRQQPAQQPAVSSDQVAQLVDRQMQWVDQYNQHLLLTVQALRHLQLAFDGKFSQ